jgi:replicative DNA helicase
VATDRLVPELPPHDEYQERSVLGALLAQPDRRHAGALLDELAPFLDPADFFREANRTVYAAILRQREALHGDGVLIGDLFRLPGMDAAALTGLVVEAAPAAVVREVALYVADLGLQRLILGGAHRLAHASPEAVDAFNQRVQAKRQRIAQARDGRAAAGGRYDPLTDARGGAGA